MIGIVDYGVGNLRSLRNAVDHVGLDVAVLTDPEALAACDRLILPGVGAFGSAAANLRARGFEAVVRAHAAAGKPLLGICVGMQLLADVGLEFGEHAGLGLIPGKVRPLESSREHPTPHVGWNDVTIQRKHAMFDVPSASASPWGKKNVDYYFVHSFYFDAANAEDVVALSEYGRSFPTVVARKNVVGCQFHPEKSQAGGLAFLERFAEWDGTC
ncbi:imidazole glycerol phosphate synthase subunit HisH [Pendulispora rubella]|uniref:Imidazole glycerol phosphate synthase subunit HisH n=1 Tax=Pendulispora rubella TaxID=2741070 RepID=A0ABZ2LHY4_9BACT